MSTSPRVYGVISASLAVLPWFSYFKLRFIKMSLEYSKFLLGNKYLWVQYLH